MRTPPSRWVVLIALLGSSLSACAEAGVWIVLDTVAGDDPYRDMRQVEVTVTRGGKNIESYRGPFVGGEIVLEPVPRADDLHIRVEGLDLDAQVVANGRVEPEMPARQGACCVHMCFCSLAVFDAGDCQCGSDQCLDSCAGGPGE